MSSVVAVVSATGAAQGELPCSVGRLEFPVNPEESLKPSSGIIANPDCSIMQMSVVFKPLHGTAAAPSELSS